MASWQISADTGGTFTDCFGVSPGAETAEGKLVKVLSSGRLRVSVVEQIDTQTLRLDIPDGWETPDGFFVGFNAVIGAAEIPVESWNRKGSELRLQAPCPAPQTPTAIDLFTGEEAPVIGARLLTGTGPQETFPPLDFRLGTTRGTNALLERKGAPTAFFVTRGFADLLVIRDQRRPDLFALSHHRSTPLYERVIEIDERLDAEGEVLTPIDSAFEVAAKAALDAGIRVAAVALLHSYRNPEHELAVRDALLRLGFDHVSLSSELAPLIRILPRAETAVVDATLTPVMRSFLDGITRALGGQRDFLTMTSAGGLEPVTSYRPKDSLLSGPAGGVVGAATAAKALGFDQIITFDMGGTSTDVARYDGNFHYRFEQKVGDARLLSPALKIETVASGGGSICQWTESGLRVGPESAGADPGPACYGRGGPLTITDVNLLLGRIDPDNFGIPISEENIAAARQALENLAREMGASAETASIDDSSPNTSHQSLLTGLASIATEQMADAIRTISIREGADPTEYALVAFGGAGPLHACDIAEKLGITTVLVPREAGLLSAFGIQHAEVERFAQRQILQPLDQDLEAVRTALEELATEARQQLRAELGSDAPLEIRRQLAELRLVGQDSTLTCEIEDLSELANDFRAQYQSIFGYPSDPCRTLELVTLRVVVATTGAQPSLVARDALPIESSPSPNPVESPTQPSSFLDRATLPTGSTISGPRVIQDPFSTLFLKAGWTATIAGNQSLIVQRTLETLTEADRSETKEPDSAIERELFRHRFENLVEEMGAMLQRSAISTNVKERADFSCALLDANGELVVNAPHIPVHLGALGLCVREVAKTLAMRPGDTIITNHPGFGGSHLPDVTLITPVFTKNSGTAKLIGYVANRAHHAEIGGISPGSMPPDARSLAEEGVVISPTKLVAEGKAKFDEIEQLLTLDSPFPTRHLADNLADLHAQLASNRRGVSLLETLADEHGDETVRNRLEGLATQARDSLRSHLDATGFRTGTAVERLDDGTEISVHIHRHPESGKLTIDFTGTAPVHPGNLHATPAIVRSAVLYVLRLWTQSPVPLNEGLLRDVEIVLPNCFLNPDFPDDPSKCPAVVGGNVETSQRVVDTLIRALGFQAGSQGTMNNFIFGNDRFGYYETIGGGAGAGPDYDGASGLHTHMTNTAITDPEIFEQRYPVRLRQFAIRRGSGGEGQHRGGDGLIREVEFLEPLRVSLLTQHRKEAPFGLNDGATGTCGRQTLSRRDGFEQELEGITAIAAEPGDRLKIETPGGGACG